MPLKMLYLCSQETMEHEELSMFNELGFDILSTGSYLDNRSFNRLSYNPISIKYNYSLVDEFKSLFPDHITNIPLHIPKEFLRKFDIIFCSHFPDWLNWNYEHVQDKLVIFRSFGLSNRGIERELKKFKQRGVIFVAATQGEQYIPEYVPRDYFIRASLNKKDFEDTWEGSGDFILTVQKRMAKMSHYTRFDIYESVTSGFNRILCGFENEDLPWAHTNASHDAIKKFRSQCKVYFSGCSRPAPLTYTFVEALASGCPVVSVGKDIAVFPGPDWGKGFDPEYLIKNGENGFISSDVKELQYFIKLLLGDEALRKKLSKNGKETAFTYFDRCIIINQWKNLFKDLGISL